jgi:hypothetical protein
MDTNNLANGLSMVDGVPPAKEPIDILEVVDPSKQMKMEVSDNVRGCTVLSCACHGGGG